ncbi:MAG: ATP-binding protein [Solidesulfovibrio sp.]|uniref:ATP-binding protein n=1 Tax=Solidesulfovibrio sp. TaxID=2910990 RepID=UPI002B21ADA3|nr:ATP-binding protein [Solidesulfovibrio sp.]MEA4858786.1 ATP-binding protein [Solidesulfovibrio sp.]
MFAHRRVSLKLKMFGGAMAVVLFVSAVIALLARWILVTSLNRELEQRGVAIGQSLSERASGFILDKDRANLVSLVFDAAQLGERRILVSYIFIEDAEGRILANTFIRPFPGQLTHVNPLPDGAESSIKLVDFEDKQAIDIAVPVREGIYTLGAVHVGLSKSHIDSLVGTLRTTFLGFIAAVTVVMFLIVLRLSNAVAGPIARLTRAADAVSRGSLEEPAALLGLRDTAPRDCPAYADTDLPCWHFDQSRTEAVGANPQNVPTCRECRFYRKAGGGDEVAQLAESFGNMIWSIRLYRRRLRESEEKYRSLFDSNPDPVFVVEAANGRILDANSQAEDVYGYARKELLGRAVGDLEPGAGEVGVAAYLGDRDAPDRVLFPKLRHVRKNGAPLYVNLHACRIAYRGRDAVIVSATDVTELVEKDAQLIQASKMKTLGEMSAGIAHELNQPLNAIKLGSDYLRLVTEGGKLPPADNLAAVTAQISEQVDRAAAIIAHLRDFGRKSQPQLGNVDLNDPIRGVFAIIGHDLSLQDIAVRLDLGTLSPIKAHANRLEQVFFNLVVNARDALLAAACPDNAAKGRAIAIATRMEQGRVTASVADNGCGIPENVRHKIFEPFFTTKQAGQGMGLGLAITYGIVKDYGGDILVDDAPGGGCVFRLTFPAARDGAPQGA